MYSDLLANLNNDSGGRILNILSFCYVLGGNPTEGFTVFKA